MTSERYLELPAVRVRTLLRPGDPAQTVVFLHGITSSASTWEPQIERLPEEINAIAYDSLGGGYTERHGPRAPITRADQRELLFAVLAELGVDRFRVVAHSMGCGAALGAAAREPERVEAVLAVSPATQGRTSLNMTMRMARFAPTARLLELSAPLVVPRAARAKARELAGGRDDPEVLEREAGHALARPREQARGFVDLIGKSDPRLASPDSDLYGSIECPVWILRGGRDHDWMPESHEERYRDLIPQANLIRWPKIGHSPHIEAPERFAELLQKFLAETNRSTTD